jgi:alpha-1,6-mannosyltransferase
MPKFSSTNWNWIVVYVLGLVYLNYFGSQNHFITTFLVFVFLFAVYIYFIRVRDSLSEKSADLLALIFHIVPLFAIPTLSPDIYRFIWDGEILTHGIHPYAYTPQELTKESVFHSSHYLNSLYSELTDLSKSNYSLYPTVNQLYFVLPALITENVLAAVVFMKALVLGSGILGYIYLKKILKILKLSVKNGWILAINPFIITELTGNLHFEGVMLSWLFVAFYLVLTKKWILAALFWAIAVNVKLMPLILLPFLLRFIGWRAALKMYLLVGVFTVLILGIYLRPSVLPNFMQSIELYFNNFQFNSSLFAITEFLVYPVYDYETILIVGPLLSKISLVLICFFAVFRPINSGKVWFERMLWGYLIYLLFATTVHPWYIVFPFGLSILTKNSFMIGWTFLIMLSYGFFSFENKIISESLIVIEYTGLFILILLDIFFQKKHHFFQRFLKL